MRKYLFGVILFSLSLIIPRSVTASTSSLEVSPAILEAIVSTQHDATSSAQLTNTTNFPIPIKAQVDAFTIDQTLSAAQKNTYNASHWFTLDPTDFILQPHETKTVQIKLSAPPDAEPGGHYATIYFQPLIPDGVVSPTSTISLARVGVLCFLIVPGELDESLAAPTLTTAAFRPYGPLTFHLSLHNLGNVHLLSTGTLTIKNLAGQIVYTTPLSLTTILPQTTKDLDIIWDKAWLMGRYTANVTLNYGINHQEIKVPPLVFWVFPWPHLLSLIVLLTLVYKIFIVHIDRFKLALAVLRGHNVKNHQTIPSHTHQRSRGLDRSHPRHPRALGRDRRHPH